VCGFLSVEQRIAIIWASHMAQAHSARDAIQSSYDLAIRCLDLTSLDGSETEEQVRALCGRALRPDAEDPTVPSVAAVVLYPRFVRLAAEILGDAPVRVASVAGFPFAEGSLESRLQEIRQAVADGAGEIDVVMNRSAFDEGREEEVSTEIAGAKQAAGPALLKVILETGELATSKRIEEAAHLAMSAGADFIKSSTGKVGSGITHDAALAMMEAVRDHGEETGRSVGVKVSGGVRTAEQALSYLELLEKTLGDEWLSPDRFRIGASSLLDQLVALRTGRGGEG
jgi:deoxyribose-phosphate aldolase